LRLSGIARQTEKRRTFSWNDAPYDSHTYSAQYLRVVLYPFLLNKHLETETRKETITKAAPLAIAAGMIIFAGPAVGLGLAHLSPSA